MRVCVWVWGGMVARQVFGQESRGCTRGCWRADSDEQDGVPLVQGRVEGAGESFPELRRSVLAMSGQYLQRQRTTQCVALRSSLLGTAFVRIIRAQPLPVLQGREGDAKEVREELREGMQCVRVCA